MPQPQTRVASPIRPAPAIDHPPDRTRLFAFASGPATPLRPGDPGHEALPPGTRSLHPICLVIEPLHDYYLTDLYFPDPGKASVMYNTLNQRIRVTKLEAAYVTMLSMGSRGSKPATSISGPEEPIRPPESPPILFRPAEYHPGQPAVEFLLPGVFASPITILMSATCPEHAAAVSDYLNLRCNLPAGAWQYWPDLHLTLAPPPLSPLRN